MIPYFFSFDAQDKLIIFDRPFSIPELDDEQKEYLNAAQNSAESLLSLINDILDFTKIEAGMISLDYQALHLRKRLRPLVTMFQPRAQEKNLEFGISIGGNVPAEILGDPMRLRQIVSTWWATRSIHQQGSVQHQLQHG